MTEAKNKKLVIVGAGEFGGMACEYFADDTDYEVSGFAVEQEYRAHDRFMDLPVVDFDSIEQCFPSDEFDAFVAVTYVHLNAERKRLAEKCVHKGYRLASYVSSRSYIGRDVIIGQGAFVMENCSLQRCASIGPGSVVWNGCNVAHRTTIREYCWIAPGTSIGGFSAVGSRCFVGVGSSIGDHVEIVEKTVIGAGSVVTKSVFSPATMWTGNPLVELSDRSYARFTGSFSTDAASCEKEGS